MMRIINALNGGVNDLIQFRDTILHLKGVFL